MPRLEWKTNDTRPPTFKNWVFTLENLILPTNTLKDLGIETLVPRFLNQDPLENFFGKVRQRGSRWSNPSCHAFGPFYKSLLVTNLVSKHSVGGNCEDDGSELLIPLQTFILQSENQERGEAEITAVEIPSEVLSHILNDLEKNAIAYVGGCILKNIKIKKCEEATPGKKLWACVKIIESKKIFPMEVRYIHKFKEESWSKKKKYKLQVRRKVLKGIVLFLGENRIDVKNKIDTGKRISIPTAKTIITASSDTDQSVNTPNSPIPTSNGFMSEEWIQHQMDSITQGEMIDEIDEETMTNVVDARRYVEAVTEENRLILEEDSPNENIENIESKRKYQELEERYRKLEERCEKLEEELRRKNFIVDKHIRPVAAKVVKKEVGSFDQDTGQIYLGENVSIAEVFASWLNLAKPAQFVKKITRIVFGEEVLRSSTLSGRTSNRSKKDIQPMRLDDKKLAIITDIFSWLNLAKPAQFVKKITRIVFGEEVLRSSTLSGRTSNRSKKDIQPMRLDDKKLAIITGAKKQHPFWKDEQSLKKGYSTDAVG
ncbi:uncharacterized protein LOC123302987 [Chrysoperla carnea]|uniref:uncharacterized protein LOC123302987 n=1 Tax=Chrysoperla carnea TaxID=189513 RepID=UPI001D09149F|nr:uncharacterized protein LOC123302987 [Chrysoperla carnea]